MAKRKNSIDFISAQKMMGSAGKNSSFETFLVIAVIIVAGAMITWFMLTKVSYDKTVSEIDALKYELDNSDTATETDKNGEVHTNVPQGLNDKYAYFKKICDEYYVCDGQDGRELEIITNASGKKEYKTYSLQDLRTKYETDAINAQSTSEEVKGVIDLTSTVLDMLMVSASASGNTVKCFSISDGTIILTVEAGSNDSLTAYYKFLNGTSNASFYGGCSPKEYIAAVSYTASKEGASSTYIFTMELISDTVSTSASK